MQARQFVDKKRQRSDSSGSISRAVSVTAYHWSREGEEEEEISAVEEVFFRGSTGTNAASHDFYRIGT